MFALTILLANTPKASPAPFITAVIVATLSALTVKSFLLSTLEPSIVALTLAAWLLPKALQIFKSIKPLLDNKGITFDLFKTNYKEHAIKITRNLDFTKYNGLFMIGGDGTFHEIVTGIMTRKDQKKIPIGIIPGGSGNSFLYDLNKKNPMDLSSLFG